MLWWLVDHEGVSKVGVLFMEECVKRWWSCTGKVRR